ncbi:MAG: undecaprenyl-diphosphate phosphatase [Deltaproteobacteria bacterium]|nr:undecaprenyl-diphosphate phosphatase [Deltaproteobacteria bacterium]
MDIVSSIFLGIIQGLTEFLPISSSGHLVLFQNLLGFKEPALFLDASLHLGTLIAVCLYFRNDLKKIMGRMQSFTTEVIRNQKSPGTIADDPDLSLALWILAGTIPTGFIGIFFKSRLESMFDSVPLVGAMLLVTGLILATTWFLSDGYCNRKNAGLITALAVGFAQGLAIIPGISRSGATIVCGMLLGMDREAAARFSFLLSIPAIIGAVILQINSESLRMIGILPLLAGFISSVAVGLAALKILMGLIRKGNISYFAPYCWAAGLLIIYIR